MHGFTKVKPCLTSLINNEMTVAGLRESSRLFISTLVRLSRLSLSQTEEVQIRTLSAILQMIQNWEMWLIHHMISLSCEGGPGQE